MSYYDDEARSSASNTVAHFLDEIVESYLDKGKASNDLFNFYHGDRYHHEYNLDVDYSLVESAEILEEISQHKETDRGLWEGLEPEKAIKAQAAYTYGNAIMYHWKNIIKEINDDETLQELYEKFLDAKSSSKKQKLKNKVSDYISDTW